MRHRERARVPAAAASAGARHRHADGGLSLPFTAALLYFGSLALEGVLSSAQETLLEMFGQRMTHALRSEMSRKLTHLSAATLSAQNPGEVAARFSGDVDTVEALFTSGVISMAADACRILSIFAVIAVKNPGLAVLLLLVMPVLTVFTRHVQKRMLSAQLENRHAVAAISGRCRKRCTTSAPSTRWDSNPTWDAATIAASAKATPPWKRRIFTTRSTRR